MQEIRVPFKQFNLEQFAKDMVKSVDKDSNQNHVIAYIEEFGGTIRYSDKDKDRNFLEELKDEKKILYFIFTDENCGELTECFNGTQQCNEEHTEENEDSDEENEDDDDEEENEDEQWCSGYLLQYIDGEIIINSACELESGMCFLAPSVDIGWHIESFDKPMELFIRKYIG